MKKTVLTIAIVLGITLAGMAQGNGLFGRGPQSGSDDFGYGNYGYYDESATRDPMIALPGSHGSEDDQTTPLAGGALLLIGFGAAYALKKRNEK